MRLIALKSGRYGTRALKVGDPFDATRQYGRIWIALGHAAKAPAVEAPKDEPKKRGRKPKAAESAQPTVAEPEVAAPVDPIIETSVESKPEAETNTAELTASQE